MLGRRGLDGDTVLPDPEDRSEGGAHRADVGRQLRALEGYRDVGVGHLVALAGDDLHHLGQQLFAVDALPLGRGVGKQVAYVALGEGAEKRVA